MSQPYALGQSALIVYRDYLLMCCQLWGNECWDQYVKDIQVSILNAFRYWFSTAVANEQGSFTTPSFVSFTDEERLIGEAAKNQAAMNPANTIFDIKYVRCTELQGPIRRPIIELTWPGDLSGEGLMILRWKRTLRHGLSRLSTKAETLWCK